MTGDKGYVNDSARASALRLSVQEIANSARSELSSTTKFLVTRNEILQAKDQYKAYL